MKKTITSMLTLLALCMPALSSAQDYQKYYNQTPVTLNQPQQVNIPSRSITLTEAGGIGDGVTLCTKAIQDAIDKLAQQGGGHLIVPTDDWLTGPIELKDHIDLHLEKNAIIYFSPDKSIYRDADTKARRVYPCIRAEKRTDIAITGEGIIDGNGAQWRPVKRSKVSDTEWSQFKSMGGQEMKDGTLWYPWQMRNSYPDIAKSPVAQEQMRNDLVRFETCKRDLFQGVTFQNSPRFHVHPCYSSDIIIDGITVRCPWNAQNGDGIDLSDCQRVLVVNSTVNVGDDGICLKSGRPKASAVSGCEDILVENNTVYHAHGAFVLGSETAAGVRRVVARNCRFAGTETGLRFKSGVGRGGETSQLYISNIVMTDIKDEAVVFQCDYVNRPAGASDAKALAPKGDEAQFVPHFQDIHIDNIICRGAETAIKAHGIEGMQCVREINISNSTFVYSKKGEDIDTSSASVKLTNVRLLSDKKQ